MGVLIRNAERQDSQLITQVLGDLAKDIGDSARYRGNETAIGQYGFGPEKLFDCLIAEEHQAAVGLAIYFPTFSTTRGEAGVYLQDLWVARNARGKGIGNTLIQQVSTLAWQQWGASHIVLSVYKDNPQAIAFYESLGFAISAREQHAVLEEGDFWRLTDRA